MLRILGQPKPKITLLFRREPHNYDKAQPTLHQTNIYQQMLAEQQKNQQMQQHTQHLQQPSLVGNTLQHQTTVYQPAQQQQQQSHAQLSQHSVSNTYTQSPQQYNTNLLNNSSTYGNSTDNITNIVSSPLETGQVQGQNVSTNNQSGGYGLMTSNQGATQMTGNNQSNNSILHNIKIEVPSTDVLNMFNLSQGAGEGYTSYKPYNHAGNFKKSASTGTYINIRGNTSNNQLYMQHQDQNSPGGGTTHAQSLPLTLGVHLPSLTNALQTRSAQLSPPNIQQPSQQRIITQQLNLPPQVTQSPAQQQQSSIQNILNTQQQHLHQQISQSTISSNTMVPKEIFRSNSLPLNVSLQKFDQRLTQLDNNFVVPTKYHLGKSTKTRSRSNSIHQHMMHSSPSSSSSSSNAMLINSGPGGVGGITNSNGINLNSQLQAATSDPMLNSTLAQLLTTSKSPTYIQSSSFILKIFPPVILKILLTF